MLINMVTKPFGKGLFRQAELTEAKGAEPKEDV